MQVAAQLPAPSFAFLRRVLGDENTLIDAGGWEQLMALVRSRPVDVVVIDPRAGGAAEFGPLFELLERWPSLPVVVYTALAPEMLQRTVELARRGVRTVVLRGFDDEPRRFRELLERLPADRIGARAFESVADVLEGAGPIVRRAFTRLFESPHLVEDVESLAQSAGMTRRTLDRWLEKRGLASARRLIFSARLAQAWHYLGEEGFLLEDIARKVGCGSSRAFARQVRAATGMAPSRLREAMAHEEFMAALAKMMRRRGGMEDDEEVRSAREDPGPG
ncbi:MAG TPA: helix-turn-helix domain-containing protein [Gemmatimonadaceae bacterium]|nr:helix-turn-helix domain-containing protein [Gemmatimonadaceae bacterium]